MPFKGDMRLGGPHDNEASLNGTSSDFAGVPAAGTILSGPTDTSRVESDYVGNQFLMPYSTTVYADGNGGQNSVETWGLQYLPAGWVTMSDVVSISIPASFTLWNGTTVGPSSTIVGSNQTLHIEDGTGINYTSTSTNYLYAEGDSITGLVDGYLGGNPVYRWQIQFQGGNAVLAIDNTMHPTLGTYAGSSSSDAGTSWGTCGGFFIWGTNSESSYHDGQGGSYSEGSTSDSVNIGTYVGECNGEYFYYSGSGTYYTGYAPYGTQSSSYSTSTLTWYSDTGSYGGEFTYASIGCTYIADGMGGYSSQSCGSWSANYGDSITSGSYTSFSGDGTYDEWGNENGTTTNFYWTHRYNGSGGYYTDTYTN